VSPICVAVVGTGFFGGGLLRRLAVLDDFEPRVVANRTLDHALTALRRAGVDPGRTVVTNDRGQAQAALSAGRTVATTDLELATTLDGVDVVAEATGHLLIGTEVAVAAIRAGKHVVAANSDVHATVGPMLKVLADEAGVVYTDIDGDEPGLLNNLYDSCKSMGLEVAVMANGKGVLKRYATPATQAAYAAEYGLQPWLATAAADGTKLNFELTVVANASGFVPAVQGMHGPALEVSDIVAAYERLGLLDGGQYVDYVLGPRGVFAIVRSDDPEVQSDFRYAKMGDGPFYLFHEQRVLIHYQAPGSIARAVRRHEATVAPMGAPCAETVAFAKRDLAAGQHLDGIGGFDTYGLIVRADEAVRQGLVPIGVSQYARLVRPLRRDEPITYDAVELEGDNLALELRRKQDARFSAGQPALASA
jgi:predicted homoserine dehydrogenase-like protein